MYVSNYDTVTIFKFTQFEKKTDPYNQNSLTKKLNFETPSSKMIIFHT